MQKRDGRRGVSFAGGGAGQQPSSVHQKAFPPTGGLIQPEQHPRVLRDVGVETTAQALVRGHGDSGGLWGGHGCTQAGERKRELGRRTCCGKRARGSLPLKSCLGKPLPSSRLPFFPASCWPTWVISKQPDEGIHAAAGALHSNLRILHL